MILAERDLLKKVWKKAAIPIWASDHPNDITKRRTLEVFMKNAESSIIVPNKKKIKLVITHNIKLNTKKVSQ